MDGQISTRCIGGWVAANLEQSSNLDRLQPVHRRRQRRVHAIHVEIDLALKRRCRKEVCEHRHGRPATAVQDADAGRPSHRVDEPSRLSREAVSSADVDRAPRADEQRQVRQASVRVELVALDDKLYVVQCQHSAIHRHALHWQTRNHKLDHLAANREDAVEPREAEPRQVGQRNPLFGRKELNRGRAFGEELATDSQVGQLPDASTHASDSTVTVTAERQEARQPRSVQGERSLAISNPAQAHTELMAGTLRDAATRTAYSGEGAHHDARGSGAKSVWRRRPDDEDPDHAGSQRA